MGLGVRSRRFTQIADGEPQIALDNDIAFGIQTGSRTAIKGHRILTLFAIYSTYLSSLKVLCTPKTICYERVESPIWQFLNGS
jgi:hypothetical protein